MIFNPLNNSYRIGTRVSDLGFKHMVLNRSTVLNCPLRKKYYPNKYKGGYKKYKVSEPVKYLFISICPFLEFLMEKSSGLVEESEEL